MGCSVLGPFHKIRKITNADAETWRVSLSSREIVKAIRRQSESGERLERVRRFQLMRGSDGQITARCERQARQLTVVIKGYQTTYSSLRCHFFSDRDPAVRKRCDECKYGGLEEGLFALRLRLCYSTPRHKWKPEEGTAEDTIEVFSRSSLYPSREKKPPLSEYPYCRIFVPNLLHSQYPRTKPRAGRDPTAYLFPCYIRKNGQWIYRKPDAKQEQANKRIWEKTFPRKSYPEKTDVLQCRGWNWAPSTHELRIARICQGFYKKHANICDAKEIEITVQDLTSFVWERIWWESPLLWTRSAHDPIPNFKIEQWLRYILAKETRRLRNSRLVSNISIDLPIGKNKVSNSDTQAWIIYRNLEEKDGSRQSPAIFQDADPEDEQPAAASGGFRPGRLKVVYKTRIEYGASLASFVPIEWDADSLRVHRFSEQMLQTYPAAPRNYSGQESRYIESEIHQVGAWGESEAVFYISDFSQDADGSVKRGGFALWAWSCKGITVKQFFAREKRDKERQRMSVGISFFKNRESMERKENKALSINLT